MADELGMEVEVFEGQREDDINPDHDEKQKLSEFLAEFPIQTLDYTKPVDDDGLWCFWSQTESSETSSSFDNRRLDMIHDKIKSVFANIKLLGDDDGLGQFWVPVTRGSCQLLTTFNQPFAVSRLDTGVARYRICCQKYLYDVDVLSTQAQQVEDNNVVIHGPVATAFLSHLPQFIDDMTPYSPKMHLYPLLASALNHGLRSYIVLPIFDHSATCIGVVEYCTSEFENLFGVSWLLDELCAAIKDAGLITFNVQAACRPYKSIYGLRRADDEMRAASKAVCVSHNLCVAQAWIQYDIEFMQNKQVLALNLLSYCNSLSVGNVEWLKFSGWFKFCEECRIRPLRMGEGLVGKALENHETYLCRDISMLDRNEPWLSHTAGIEGSCFVICLRSTHTPNLSYVFELFWTNSQDVVILLRSVLLTLKKNLPSFKVVFGEEIGNELSVKEIKYSCEAKTCIVEDVLISRQASETSSRKHKTSPITLNKEVITQQYGKTMMEAAKNLQVSVSTLKRKCKDVGINEWQGPKHVKKMAASNEIEVPLVVNQDSVPNETVLIKAKYGDDLVKFSLPFSATILQAVEAEVFKSFGLHRGTYKLKYYDQDKDLVTITCNDHFTDCVTSSRLLGSTAVRLHVLPIA